MIPMRRRFLFYWLLFCLSIGAAAAQTRQLAGTVKSASGETLPGVTVLVKGTTSGASTDTDGRFQVSVPAGTTSPTLVFSYVGFLTQEVPVGSGSTYDVTLTADNKQLDDVVVIGYGAVQRSELTGSVSSVSAQQIKDIPVNSAAEALTGRLAGVQLTSSEGTPGADVRIRVRGGGSITQDNSPLYVVDGIQIENALSVISPQDIQSVDVLKDAASTAIYGARGANGVVIITTKNGIEGRTSVAYSGFAGVRRLVKKLDVLKPGEFIDLQYERAARSSSDLAAFRGAYGSRNFLSDTLERARQSPFTDWQDEVFGRDAFQQTHNLTVSGGGKGTVYSLSLTSNREQGIQLASDFDRKLLNFRLDNKATDKLRIGFNVRLNDQTISGAGTASGGLSSSSRLRNTVQYRPFTTNLGTGLVLDPTQEDEEYYILSGGNNGLINPIVLANSEYRRDGQRLVNSSAYVNYNFTKGLSFRSTVGIDYRTTRTEAFNSKVTSVARQNGNQPTASIGTGTQFTLNNSNVLTYRLFSNSKHSFDMLLGQEVYQTLNTSLNVSAFYLPTDIEPEKALANFNQAQAPPGFVQPSPTTNEDPNRILSGFTRINYSYDDKYLFTGTMRVDGSSKFAEGKRVGVFPAASVAWRISKEAFMQPLTAVSDLKLRLSYGLAGNNRIGDFLYNQLFQAGSAPYALNHTLVYGSSAIGLANPDLKWESTTSRNIGLDLSLLENRVQLTVDAYYNTTSDLLLNKPVPAFLGYTTQLQNVGSTSNRGLELQLTGTVIRNENFTWTATANASFNRGRIESLGGDQTEILGITSGWGGTALTQDYLARVGRPVGEMYGYVTDGFLTASDFSGYTPPATPGSSIAGTWTPRADVKFVDNLGLIGESSYRPGLLKLKDISGPNGVPDGKIDANDQTVIGNANPKMVGGLNQQFTYKGFDASLFLNFVLGNDVYNANKIEFTSNTPNTAFNNVLGVMSNRYRILEADGSPITTIDRLNEVNQNASIWTPTRGLVFHSWAVEDGSFLRVNNLTFGYTLPKTLSTRAKVQTLRFYVTLNNLYTFTKYTGYDPEVNTRRTTPLTPGVDYAAYPRSRAFLFGVNLSL